MLDDNSKLAIKDDAFGRAGFAKRLAETIAGRIDPSPLVISLDGPWGSGKSVVLEWLQDFLNKKEVITLPFNPWRYSGEAELLVQFFYQLAEKIDKELDPKGQKLVKMVKKLVIPFLGEGLGKAAEVLLEALSNQTDLDSLRKAIQNLLSEQKKPITIIIDDIDRLDPEDLFSLLRLVKLTADFPYVVFLLSMDYGEVGRVLDSRFSGKEGSGKRFLEKIIQVPIELPHAINSKFREFTDHHISVVLKDFRLKISRDPEAEQSENERLWSTFDGWIGRRIKTPRQVKQYANCIRFTLGLLSEEVSPVDVILIVGLRLFWPEIYVKIIANWFDIFAFRDNWHRRGQDGEDSEHPFWLKLADVQTDHDLAKEFLPKIFPQLIKKGTLEDSHWTRSQRIADEKYFWRLFSQQIPLDDLPDSIIDDFLQLVTNAKETQVVDAFRATNEFFVKTTSGANAQLFLHRLNCRIDALTPSTQVELAKVVASHADRLTASEELRPLSLNICEAVAIKSENLEGCVDFAMTIAEMTSDYIWADDFLDLLAKSLSSMKTQSRAQLAKYEELIRENGQKLWGALEQGRFKEQHKLTTAIWHLSRRGYNDKIKNWWSGKFKDDPHTVILLFRCCFKKTSADKFTIGTASGSVTSLRKISDNKDVVDALKQLSLVEPKMQRDSHGRWSTENLPLFEALWVLNDILSNRSAPRKELAKG